MHSVVHRRKVTYAVEEQVWSRTREQVIFGSIPDREKECLDCVLSSGQKTAQEKQEKSAGGNYFLLGHSSLPDLFLYRDIRLLGNLNLLGFEFFWFSWCSIGVLLCSNRCLPTLSTVATRPEANTTPRTSKRPKLSEVPAPDDAFPCLSLLAEVLASVSLPGSLDLVSHLLKNFNNVVYSTTSTDVDISYIEQSIMSAVEHSAEKITEAPNLAPSAIRLDIVVHFIRVSKSFKRDFLRVFTDASITYRVTVARGPLHRCVGAAVPCPKRRHRIIMAVPSQNAWRSTCTRVHSHLQYNEAVATPQHRRHGHGRHQGLDVRLRVGMYAEGEPPLVGDGVGKGWGHRSGAYMPISFLGTPALFSFIRVLDDG
ncbi:hypothetical protein B0H14DRAFT_2632727 [Mycena olivaceomarginata]|nr:hypothetical protein B0H14DRAFT_2632727 [Mycena olivaceomarginata]